jgi:transcription initiation factor TFIIH subunit 2
MREALVLLSSLTSCDPGSVVDSIAAAKKAKLRVSIIGLSAEMYLSSKIAKDTLGTYNVAQNEEHLREVVMAACAPPALQGVAVESKLVRMGFPAKDAEGARAATFVGEACMVAGGAYTCPRCGAKNDSLPCECHVCKLTLISAAHLARSYHHLFPIARFKEVPAGALASGVGRCSFCEHLWGDEDSEKRLQCDACGCLCCEWCDEFIHESLHNCPGCESKPPRTGPEELPGPGGLEAEEG